MLTWRPLIKISRKFTTVQQHVIDIIFPWFDRLLIDLISGGAKMSASPLEHETEGSCYSLPIFSDRRAFHHPYPRAFFIHIWDRTEK